MISTHAPRTGSDRHVDSRALVHSDFNPRSPHGERLSTLYATHRCTNFNPRSPHGERHNSITDKKTLLEFQPTLPARGATERIRNRT